jgi:hypothetical protein
MTDLGTAREAAAGAPPVRLVRCACARCGAHVIAPLTHTLGGNCDNCGSYELQALTHEHGR